MIPRAAILLVGFVAVAASDGAVPELALRNVELTDGEGVTTRIYGFYRLSGEDLFRGFLGEGEIEVPYERLREFRVLAPAHPAGRPRVHLTLRSGKVIRASFDQREAEQLFTGFSRFGRVTIYFRDIRRLKILGKTSRADLPAYGPPVRGLDVRLKDRQGTVTELVEFRRTVNRNAIPAVRGSATIAIPLRIVRRVVFFSDKRTGLLSGTATLKDGSTVDFRLPTYVEEVQYRGRAEFGVFRIRLGKIRELEVRRVTPELRELNPLEAARGREKVEGQPAR